VARDRRRDGWWDDVDALRGRLPYRRGGAESDGESDFQGSYRGQCLGAGDRQQVVCLDGVGDRIRIECRAVALADRRYGNDSDAPRIVVSDRLFGPPGPNTVYRSVSLPLRGWLTY